MNTYTYHEDGGYETKIEAGSLSEAVKKAIAICRDGDWGDNGAVVEVWVTEHDDEGEEVKRRELTVEIEPNHDALIEAAGGDVECDHKWSRDEVHATGGTSFEFTSQCSLCGLQRTEYKCGSQRNPGEHDTVEYAQPDIWLEE